MSEFALERLQRVRSSSGNDDVSPELERMIQCLQLKEQALREELREAAAALGPPPPAGGGWGWAGGPTHPLLIKGLVHLLQSAALGLDSTNAMGQYADQQDVLNTSSLKPLAVEVAVAGGRICYTQLGPAAAAAGVASGTTVLQLLAIGCLLMGAGDAPGAFGFLSNALAAAWEEDPPPGVQRQLSARSWVPAFPTTTTTTTSTEGGQQQQEAPAPGLTPAGRRLAEDLQRHCPGITPADLRRWALTVRLLAGLAMGSQDPAHHKLLLASCQQVLDASDCGGAGGFHAAAWGAQVALAASSWCGLDEARAGRISAFFDAALAQAVHTRCYMAANQLAVQHASWLIDLRSGAAAPARQHMLAQVQQLADTGRSCLAHLKPWLAKVFLQSLKDDQQALDADVDRLLQGGAQLRAPGPIGGGMAVEQYALPRCSGCGAAALHLRKCAACATAAYCSKDCQKVHWREGGHKQECAALAAGARPGARAARA